MNTHKKDFKGYIAYKKYKTKPPSNQETAFYRHEIGNTEDRGFIIKDGLSETHFTLEHAYPNDEKTQGLKILLGQLVISKNPFSDDKWIIIISGISGPATLGIAQMLTGCMYKEFTINDKNNNLDEVKHMVSAIKSYKENCLEKTDNIMANEGLMPYNALSEKMLNAILSKSENGITNSIISVGVYYPEEKYSNDERKIVGWNFSDLEEIMGRKWNNPADVFLD